MRVAVLTLERTRPARKSECSNRKHFIFRDKNSASLPVLQSVKLSVRRCHRCLIASLRAKTALLGNSMTTESDA